MDKKKAAAHFKKAILLSYLSPLGTAREERPHGLSGGVGGGWRKATKKRKNSYSGGKRKQEKRPPLVISFLVEFTQQFRTFIFVDLIFYFFSVLLCIPLSLFLLFS